MRLLFLLFLLILPLAIFGGDSEPQGWISCLTHQQVENGNCVSQFNEARLFMEQNPNWAKKLENTRRNSSEFLLKCKDEIGIGSDDEIKSFLDYAIAAFNCSDSLRKIELKSATELEECNNGASKMKTLAIVFIGGFLVQSIAFLVVNFLLCRRRKLTGVREIPK